MAKRARKPGDIRGVRLRLWNVILNSEDTMFKRLDGGDFEGAMRAAGVTVNAAGKYVDLLKANDQEDRIKALEAVQDRANRVIASKGRATMSRVTA